VNCAKCSRPSSEHTVLPGHGHPTSGCGSFAWSFDLSQLPRMERQVANMARLGRGEVFDHCHCLDDAVLQACPHCGVLLCPLHLAEHESNCPKKHT